MVLVLAHFSALVVPWARRALRDKGCSFDSANVFLLGGALHWSQSPSPAGCPVKSQLLRTGDGTEPRLTGATPAPAQLVPFHQQLDTWHLPGLRYARVGPPWASRCLPTTGLHLHPGFQAYTALRLPPPTLDTRGADWQLWAASRQPAGVLGASKPSDWPPGWLPETLLSSAPPAARGHSPWPSIRWAQ